MFKLTLNTIRAKLARFLLSAVAVALGVAFMAGTFVLTDTISAAYEGIAGEAYAGTDAVVRSTQVVEDPDAGEARATVDQATLDTVRTAPGVAAAEPRIEGIAQVVGSDRRLLDDSTNRATPVALAWQDEPAFSPLTLVDGRQPRAPDEVVIDRATARTGSFAVGDPVRVLTMAGSDGYRIAGIATYGGADDAGGAPVVAFTTATAAAVLGEPGRFDAIQVAAADGVSETRLARNVQAALGETDAEADAETDVETLTGTEAVAEARADAQTGLAFMTTFLLAFAIVSLLVGSFVIANTFSITVAQRAKESALLRAIGASRRQVMRSVMFESLLTGVVASAIGVLAGIATALGLQALLTSFGIDLPVGGLVVSSRTVIVSMTVGTVVTVVAAYLPARRAAKVKPIAAMRDVAVDRTGRSVKRTVIGTLVTAGGAALLALGLGGGGAGGGGGGGAALVGLGAIVVFLGVAVLGPVIARPVSRFLGAPLPVFRAMTGTLARENAVRNPRRTSATASALMIGVGLVVFITVFGASARASIAQSVDDASQADWFVDTTWGQGGLSPEVAAAIDALPESGPVVSMRYAPATVDGAATSVSALTTATAEQLIDFDLESGAIAPLGTDGIAVQADVADANGWTVGDDAEVTFAETGTQTFTVEAVYRTTEPMGDYAISTEAYDANVADAVDSFIFVDTADGVSEAQASAAFGEVLADYPTASLQTEDEFKAGMAGQINQMLNMVYALLALAVVIALFGIANTLALSVHERTRELGLLRAVGMARSQVRAAVRWESVIIALLGTTLGLVIGLGFAWALVRALGSEGFDQLSVPGTQLALVVVLGAVAGVAAAILPARRAAKVDVLTALRTS